MEDRYWIDEPNLWRRTICWAWKLFDNITIENKKELVLTWLKNECVSEEKIRGFRDALNDLNNDVENELSIIEDIANDLAYENGFVDERDCMID